MVHEIGALIVGGDKWSIQGIEYDFRSEGESLDLALQAWLNEFELAGDRRGCRLRGVPAAGGKYGDAYRTAFPLLRIVAVRLGPEIYRVELRLFSGLASTLSSADSERRNAS